MVSRIKEWIKEFIIVYNICPFAKKTLMDNSLRIVAIEGEGEELVLGVYNEIEQLLQSESKEISNTLCITKGLKEWDYFQDIIYVLEELISKQNIDDKVQIVGFHPNYAFEGEGNAKSNYTNRSPFPLIHLLKTEDVYKVIKSYPSIETIPEENIKKLNSLPRELLEKLSSPT